MTVEPPRPGFLGLGLMGGPMALNVLSDFPDLRVWNRSPGKTESFRNRGAAVSSTPADMAETCNVILLCLTGSEAVEDVLFGADGIASRAGPETVVVDHSTIFPGHARDMATRLAAGCGAGFIDAPVTGGVPGAEAGTLVTFAGGDIRVLERARPVIEPYTQRIEHVGDAGAGQLVKLCNQVVVMNLVGVYTEAVLLAERGGVDPRRLVDVFRDGLADSGLLRFLLPKMAARGGVRTATIRTALKDLDLIRRQGSESGTPVPVSATTAELMRVLVGRGGGDLDFSQLIRLFDGAETSSGKEPDTPD